MGLARLQGLSPALSHAALHLASRADTLSTPVARLLLKHNRDTGKLPSGTANSDHEITKV